MSTEEINVTLNEKNDEYTKVVLSAFLSIDSETTMEIYLKPLFIKNKKDLTFISKNGNVFRFFTKIYRKLDKTYVKCTIRIQKSGEKFNFYVEENKSNKLIEKLENMIKYEKPNMYEYIQFCDARFNKTENVKIKAINGIANKCCFKLNDGRKMWFSMILESDLITCHVFDKDNYQMLYTTKAEAKRLARMRNEYLLSVIK